MNKIKNRLKMVAAGAALATATGGAWGVEFAQAEVFPRGALSWDTSWLSIGGGNFYVPLDTCICTGTEVVYNPNRPILSVFHLRPRSAATSAASVEQDLNSHSYNRDKKRGVYDPSKLPQEFGLRESHNRPKNFHVAVIFQYYPCENNTQDILIRPDFALCPSTDAAEQEINLTKIQLSLFYQDGEPIPEDRLSDKAKAYKSTSTPLQFKINNSDFTNPTQSTKENLCVFKAGQYDTTKHSTFTVYMQQGDPSDSDSWGLLTYIYLIPDNPANNLKNAIKIFSIKNPADGQYFSSLAAIYKTDLQSTAVFVANLNTVIASTNPGTTLLSQDATYEQLKQAWAKLITKMPLLPRIKRSLESGGAFGILSVYYALNEDFTTPLQNPDDRAQHNPTTKNMMKSTLLLF
jgi:hypothetical protein